MGAMCTYRGLSNSSGWEALRLASGNNKYHYRLRKGGYGDNYRSKLRENKDMAFRELTTRRQAEIVKAKAVLREGHMKA